MFKIGDNVVLTNAKVGNKNGVYDDADGINPHYKKLLGFSGVVTGGYEKRGTVTVLFEPGVWEVYPWRLSLAGVEENE